MFTSEQAGRGVVEASGASVRGVDGGPGGDFDVCKQSFIDHIPLVPLMKQRADVLLMDAGHATSRSQAKALIKQGMVKADGKVVDKPSRMLPVNAKLEVEGEVYVGRGARKLEAALDSFAVRPDGKVCADVGASTGGFTQVLIRAGAEKVYAIDVGIDQLAPILRDDERVIVMEGTDARDAEVEERISILTVDVSFISVRLVLTPALEWLEKEADIIILLKPQFEAGPRAGKKGVIKDQEVRANVLEDFIDWCEDQGLELKGWMDSPVEGAKGNREFLVWLGNP